ncbi:MAG: hypothetical protein MJ170_04070 [Alphaproteobacteria bacterium]|nr:hypothetical protein [Alphaproteobacteria bacterium]
MQKISVWAISILLVTPAIAGGYLPTVDVSGGAYSARAAFGGTPTKTTQVSKNVVARTAKQTAKKTSDNIIAGGDILTPMRPSDNLWATSDAPLRMPRANEFTVIRSEEILPEENLDKPTVVARNNAPVIESELDIRIARLNELQKKADESVRDEPIKITSPIVATAEVEPVVETEPVKLSRMVVPMQTESIRTRAEQATSPRIASVRDDMTKLNPTELRKAFRKTFLSENKHLSAYQIDNKFDVASDMSSGIEGFTAARDLSESGGIRPLEIKIKFRNADSSLSRDNYTLLSEYAGIVVNNPKRAIQVSIPQSVINNADDKKLAARRLAIIEQVLNDTGVSEQRIMPVLANRDIDDGFLLRIISNDQYETLTKQKKNMFGDTVSQKTYKSMSW